MDEFYELENCYCVTGLMDELFFIYYDQAHWEVYRSTSYSSTLIFAS